MPRPIHPALEVIDFQTDDIGSQIEALLIDIKREIIDEARANSSESTTIDDGMAGGVFYKTRRRLATSKFKPLLEDLILRRFGIRTNVKFDTQVLGAIMPFFINKNHVLIDKSWRGDFYIKEQELVLKTLHDQKGTIDLKHATVGGIFSKYVHDVYFDVVGVFLPQTHSPAEMTAILLHEIGHAFTYYEFSNRVTTTNQILTQLVQELHGDNKPEVKQYLFKELASGYGVSEKAFEDLVEEENRVILGMRLFKRLVPLIQSQLPNDKYSETASEQLADNFAARFGYGRQLITGLDKLYINGSPEKGGEGVGFFMDLVQGIQIMIWILGSLMSGAPFIIAGMLIVLLLTIMGSGEASTDMTYDRLKIRYTRIRHQHIELLKRLDLPKEKLSKLLEDIQVMDKIINNTRVHRDLFDRLVNFISSKAKAAKESVELQQLLEAMAHNNLFVKAGEFKLAGQ